MTVDFLKTHANTLQEFAQKTTDRLKDDPDNFWLQLAAKNQRDFANKVKSELAVSLAEKSGELVDLRFIGPQADGSLSLEGFLKIMTPLSTAWKFAANRLRFGKDEGRAEPGITDALNLKLAGLSYGSTRISITGSTLPDLAGDSLLQSVLTHTFALLNSKNEDFYDAVDSFGARAAAQLRDSMNEINKAGLAVEYTWKSPSGKHFWKGTPSEIIRIKTLLDGLHDPEEYPEVISGTVSKIADTGRIELRTNEGKVQIRFPSALSSQAQQLRISMNTNIEVLTTRYHNPALNKDVFKRTMVKILD